jgi:predicted HTH transcriptional regulator
MLHSADMGDKTKWLEYFADGVRYSLQSALFRVKHALQSLTMEERPSPKEKEVLAIIEERKEVTSTDIASRLHVSRQQAFNLLKNLVNKGLLTRFGTTKASYYIMK